MIINHNMGAANAIRQMGVNQTNANNSMQKLSSGLKINKAGDDAAGLAISEKMRGQIRGLDQAAANAQDGISMIQTAEGALNETHSILQRMRELSVQSANDTTTNDDRTAIQKEMTQLGEEIKRIGETTQFNTKNLLDGSMGKAANASVANINTGIELKASVTLASTTTLTALQDKDGNDLGIKKDDIIEVSYSKNGSIVTQTITVGAGTAIGDLDSGKDFTIGMDKDGKKLEATAVKAGTEDAIQGLTITVKDSAGNVKTNATNKLSAFTETKKAEDIRSDGTATLQIGANTGQQLQIDINDMSAQALGVRNLQVGTQKQADVAIKVIDSATKKVSDERAKLGAFSNRLEHTIANLGTSSENLTSAESRIRDVNMAKEMSNFSKNNILSQAAQAMISQANQQPQQVLQLLR